MKYTILKTRINTDYSKFRKAFSSSENLKNSILELCKYDVSDMAFFDYDYRELKLTSGTAKFIIKSDKISLPVRIDFMQSTYESELCFDVFVIIYKVDGSCNKELKFKNIFTDYLESFRYKYNGNWYISDSELTDSRLY